MPRRRVEPGSAPVRGRRPGTHDTDRVAVTGRQRPGRPERHLGRAGDRLHDRRRAAWSPGGADILLIETIFDTLNAKAAIFAVESLFEELGFRVPVMISGTITDASGRTLSGQTVEAFWASVRHARPLSVGPQLRPRREAAAAVPPGAVGHRGRVRVGISQRRSAERLRRLRRAATRDRGRPVGQLIESGSLNFVGGCCGTTPAHIRAIAAAAAGRTPRERARRSRATPACRAWSR